MKQSSYKRLTRTQKAVSSSRSFQMAAWDRMVWKAYLESVQTFRDCPRVKWKAWARVISLGY